MDRGEKIKYWVDLADYDLDTANAMLISKRYLYVGFMCHQVIEKIIKAYYSSKNDDSPPYTHNLKHIANQTDKVVLFGSYAKGNFTENSDIDVAIIVNSITDDFLNISTKLCKLTRNIDYRIEPVLLDINTDKRGFTQDILKYGIIIYDKNTAQLTEKKTSG